MEQDEWSEGERKRERAMELWRCAASLLSQEKVERLRFYGGSRKREKEGKKEGLKKKNRKMKKRVRNEKRQTQTERKGERERLKDCLL